MLTIEYDEDSDAKTNKQNELEEALCEEEGLDEEEEEEEEAVTIPEADVEEVKPIYGASHSGRGRMAIQRHSSTEKFQAAVTKVQLVNKIVRRMQFHTTRTVARAITGPGEAAGPGGKKKTGTEAGHFPTVLKFICQAIRGSEQCYLVVELQSPLPGQLLHYLIILRTRSSEGLKEDMLLCGEVRLVDNKPDSLQFCVGIPITCKVIVRLEDGDGSFVISDSKLSVTLKPANIQSQWAAIDFLADSIQNALDQGYMEHGKSHAWTANYTRQLQDTSHWMSTSTVRRGKRKSIMDIFDMDNTAGISVTKNIDIPRQPRSKYTGKPIDSLDEVSKLVVSKIRSVMYSVDLDEASCKSIRTQVEVELGMSLDHHKEFIEERILLTFGQMDEPSLIKNYLYLGSEWNAYNWEELIENGVTHVLNVTSEIDSPFKSSLKYYRVDVLDVPESNLLRHWEDTHKFVRDCKNSNGKVLIHCQMGISRSGSTTMSYLMREYNLSLTEAYTHVKSRRSCVKPNRGFQKQLELYEEYLGRSELEGSLGNVLQNVHVEPPK